MYDITLGIEDTFENVLAKWEKGREQGTVIFLFASKVTRMKNFIKINEFATLKNIEMNVSRR